MSYLRLSDEVQQHIKENMSHNWTSPYRCQDNMVIRRNMDRDKANLWRSSYVRDTEKIIHCPYYSRYADKTQVFSFYKNDDITRRAYHVQLVSRIARNIGKVLGLNEELIEAIALGHDIGHTPFGHAGERYLSNLLYSRTSRYFNHNVHSARVLDNLFSRNVSLQTLDGILCHNGEFEQQEYKPRPIKDFADFDNRMERCYVDQNTIKELVPYTLEACVVRICDMIAYIGKDRQDAIKAKLLENDSVFNQSIMGVKNAEMINNFTVNIIENSYGKDYILMDETAYNDLKIAKRENYEYIYFNKTLDDMYKGTIEPMFNMLYERLLKDLKGGNKSSMIYKHHIDFVNENRGFYNVSDSYELEEPNQIVVDYIASMTDDYFIDLFDELFPKSDYKIKYIGYFN